jgi:ABC-type amino acid transport substrate-binding protein
VALLMAAARAGMPVAQLRSMPAYPPPLPHVYQTELDEETERRHLIKQRALDLKRALAQSTLLITGSRKHSFVGAKQRDVRGVRWLWLCVAALGGALSTLIPVASHASLPGQLGAAQAGTARRAVLVASSAQCARLRLSEPAWVQFDQLQLGAQLTQIVPRAGDTCQVELQLHDSEAVQALAAGSALLAVLPEEPSSWLVAVASDPRLSDAPKLLRERVRTLQVQRRWNDLRQLFANEEH